MPAGRLGPRASDWPCGWAQGRREPGSAGRAGTRARHSAGAAGHRGGWPTPPPLPGAPHRPGGPGPEEGGVQRVHHGGHRRPSGGRAGRRLLRLWLLGLCVADARGGVWRHLQLAGVLGTPKQGVKLVGLRLRVRWGRGCARVAQARTCVGDPDHSIPWRASRGHWRWAPWAARTASQPRWAT
jgi:hypothetical protein